MSARLLWLIGAVLIVIIGLGIYLWYARETVTLQYGNGLVEAIEYQGKYIPVDELDVMKHSGCDDAPHWHSKPEPGLPVTATDGSTVYDPGPECGFGKVSEVPVEKINP